MNVASFHRSDKRVQKTDFLSEFSSFPPPALPTPPHSNLTLRPQELEQQQFPTHILFPQILLPSLPVHPRGGFLVPLPRLVNFVLRKLNTLPEVHYHARKFHLPQETKSASYGGNGQLTYKRKIFEENMSFQDDLG
ncbi:hypothetical protein TNCV_2060181 [Trichonephila clavipes]|nr:hypothetical protein TNCV_2060181 [Trichonephila clavipes]